MHDKTFIQKQMHLGENMKPINDLLQRFDNKKKMGYSQILHLWFLPFPRKQWPVKKLDQKIRGRIHAPIKSFPPALVNQWHVSGGHEMNTICSV